MIGYKFFKNNNILWREHQSALIPLSPPKSFTLSRQEATALLKSKNCKFIRWESHFDEYDSGDWWHVVKSDKEELDSLPRKVRQRIRRAQKDYYVEKCDKELILQKGYPVYCQAYERYETHEPQYSLERFIQGVSELPDNTEFFALFDRELNELVGFSENYIESNTCFYVTMWVSPDALKEQAGYLFFHVMNQHYLNDLGFDYVDNGARSISHDTNIQDYLITKFGFRKAYSNLEIVYRFPISYLIAVLYPIRHLFYPIKMNLFKKISIIMRQEEIYRKCKRRT